MEDFLVKDIHVLHLFLALPAFALLGAVFHVLRVFYKYLPYRYPNKPYSELLLSGRFSYLDWFGVWDSAVGAEYDDDGFYKIYSWRNFRNYVQWTTVWLGLIWIAIPEFAESVSGLMDVGFGQIFELAQDSVV